LKPYLSIIATSRNDNHGGDMLLRMQTFVRGLIHQANQFQLPCELIMVEWNPPAGAPLLHEVLPKPSSSDFLKIRYVIVPAAYHQTLRNSDSLPLFQMIAKNVGIRRAEAEFVLCTNVDLFFSDALFAFLAKRQLQKDAFYRANRCDIPREIDPILSIPELLKWAEKNVTLRLGKFPDFPLLPESSLYKDWQKNNRWLLKVFNLIVQIKWTKAQKMAWIADSYACGDFTLMSKAAWEKIEGYLEFEIYSLHIDTLGIYSALAVGIKQIVLPADHCAYHISHNDGWEEFKTPIDKLNFVAKRHVLSWDAVHESFTYILKERRTFGMNPENWGLRDMELAEIRVGYGE